MPAKSSTSEFIRKARAVHGEKYGYGHVEYVRAIKNIAITCLTHGDFLQTPANHLTGYGCPRCGKEQAALKIQNASLPAPTTLDMVRLHKQNDFIAKAQTVHGNAYDYSLVVYKNVDAKVTIVCQKHGQFEQSPYSHLKGSRCPVCVNHERAIKKRSNTAEFVIKAKQIHADRYDYSETAYINSGDKVNIICRVHGVFSQCPESHLAGNGCPVCGTEDMAAKLSLTLGDFVLRSTAVHGNRYDYSQADYRGKDKKVVIICPDHGAFKQTPRDHWDGCGCVRCKKPSLAENELVGYLRSLGHEVVHQDRTKIKSPKGRALELDVYLPQHKLAIEYNGLIWHSEMFKNPVDAKAHMVHKQRLCRALGIRLIHIYEDEWQHKKEACRSFLRHLTNSTERRIHARNLQLLEMPLTEANSFLDKYHLQGKAVTGSAYGLQDPTSKEVHAVAVFSRELSARGRKADQQVSELTRYCTNASVRGGASKLLNHFIKTHPAVKTIVSYSDNRLSDGHLYSVLGFTRHRDVPQSYYYTDTQGCIRAHKSKFCRKNLPKLLKTFDADLSERDNCARNGYYRIWDCGHIKWSLAVN